MSATRSSQAPRLGLLTCVWQRVGVAECVLTRAATVARQSQAELLAVGSEGGARRDQVTGLAWGYLHAQNDPLGAKWNAGMASLRALGVDGVLVLGSDDLINEGLLSAWRSELKAGTPLAGLLDLFVVRRGDSRALYWPGYPEGPRFGETVGAGRLLSAELLDRVDWRPWPDEVNRGLDGAMMTKLRRVAPDLVARERRVGMQAIGAVLVDVKTDPDVDMNHWSALAESPGTQLIDREHALGFLPEDERVEIEALLAPAPGPYWESREQTRISAAIVMRCDDVLHLEEAGRCLMSIKGLVDECVVVLDDRSIDAADELLRGLGASVHRRAWTDDFSAARNEAAGRCRGEWILVIDRDEELIGRDALREALDLHGDAADAIAVNVHSYNGRPRPETMASVRVYRRGCAEYRYPVHNQLEGYRRLRQCDARIVTSYTGQMDARAQRALPMLEKLIQESPEDPHGHYFLARTYAAIGDAARAIEHARRCTDLAPDTPAYAGSWVWVVAMTLQRQGPDAAEKELAEALRHHPELPDLRYLQVVTASWRWAMTMADTPVPYAFVPSQWGEQFQHLPAAAKLLGMPFSFETIGDGDDAGG